MRRSGSILVVFLCLSHALIALAQTPAASGKATLYQRLGGYDGIASYIPLVFPRVAQHPELSHLFRGHGADSQQRQFDIVTSFDAIHDQAHPDKVLQNIWEALKPGGTYFMLDEAGSSNLEENLDHPLGPFLYAASVLHCMTVSLALCGAGLGTMWGEQTARRMLGEAGFQNVTTKKFEPDIEHVYYTATKV
jgi:SAM-dependent methyltransferase